VSTTRRLNVEVVGSASSFLAMMNRVTSGVTRFGSGLGMMNRNAQQGSRWMQALSTTLRYAFAGRVIYGIQNAVNNLAEFKTQLGEIDALAGRINNQGQFVGLGGQLDSLGKQALLMSNRFGVAVPEVEAYMQRFYTSFKPKGTAKQQAKEMTDFVNAHLELVTMLGGRGGDPNVLAGGLAGLIRSMPGGEKQAGRNAQILSNYFAKIVTSSPNLTGQDIASAAGRLASAKTLSGMSIRDVLGVFGVAAQTGGSSAVITRGVTQLLGSSLLHPTKPQSLSVYQQAGLPTDPNALSKMGGTRVLESLLRFANPSGKPGGANQLNLNAIYAMFSRQESVRQFVNLLANGGVPALKNFNKGLDAAADANVVHQRAQARLDQSLLVRMHQASTNLGIALVQGANPVLENLVARPMIGLSNLAIKHPNVVQGVEAGALSLGAANALRRFGAFGKLGGKFGGRFGRFLSGATAVEQAAIGQAISKEELPSLISGGKTDGSRGNPFWVVISPVSWQLGQPGGGFGSDPTNPLNKLPGNKSGGGFSIGGFLKKVGDWGTKIAGPAALAARFGKLGAVGIGAMTIADLAAILTYPGDTAQGGPKLRNRLTIHPTNPNKSLASLGVPATEVGPLLAALNQTGQLGAFRQGQIQTIKFEGNPKADLTIKLVDAQGRTIVVQEHKGVPILPKAKTFPSSQGKPGSRKGT
jgi:hypothetical protein